MELQVIQSKIYEIRGRRVMLDFDLAALYRVETRRLNEAVKRNSQPEEHRTLPQNKPNPQTLSFINPHFAVFTTVLAIFAKIPMR